MSAAVIEWAKIYLKKKTGKRTHRAHTGTQNSLTDTHTVEALLRLREEFMDSSNQSNDDVRMNRNILPFILFRDLFV